MSFKIGEPIPDYPVQVGYRKYTGKYGDLFGAMLQLKLNEVLPVVIQKRQEKDWDVRRERDCIRYAARSISQPKDSHGPRFEIKSLDHTVYIKRLR